MTAFSEWLNLIEEWEIDHVIERFSKIDRTMIVEGDLDKDMPNQVLIDTGELNPDKPAIITVAHYIRPCPDDVCEHTEQYECYLADCECCTDECT